MKVYQLKLCVRGNPAAMQTVLVEAEDYKSAIVKSIEKLAKVNNIAVEELAVQDIKVLEDVGLSQEDKNKEIALELVKLAVGKDGSVTPDLDKIYNGFYNKINTNSPPESIDILRVDESHKEREIVGEENK